MSKILEIEVYENEVYDKKKKQWIPYKDEPFTLKETMSSCRPVDDFNAPANGWFWISNWKIKRPSNNNEQDITSNKSFSGWEYSYKNKEKKKKKKKINNNSNSNSNNLLTSNSTIITNLNDISNCNFRRRLWYRKMSNNYMVPGQLNTSQIINKIQKNLNSLHSIRIKIEEILIYEYKNNNNNINMIVQSDEMKNLVNNVVKNIDDIINMIDEIEKGDNDSSLSSPNNPSSSAISSSNFAILKKLRNDVQKEELAINQAFLKFGYNIVGGGIEPVNSNSTSNSVASSFSSSFVPSSMNSNRFGMTTSSPYPLSKNSNQFNTSNNNIDFNLSSSVSSTSSLSSYTSLNKNNSSSSITSKPLTSKTTGGKGSLAFALSNTTNTSSYITDENEEGVFMDKNTQERLIESKLIPVCDESTLMTELIEERNQEIETIHKGLVKVNELFHELQKLVGEQGENIQIIAQNTEATHQKTEQALSHIIQSNKIHEESSCIIC